MAYRLCHHDFEGLSTKEAAERMNITQREVNRLLERMEKAAPHYQLPFVTPTVLP